MNPNINFDAPVDYNGEEYMDLYTGFMSKYRTAEVSAEEVGETLARLAQYYAAFNLRVTKAERALSVIAQDINSRVDEASGKAITSSKAEVFVAATPEAEKVAILKAHRENIDMFISSLRSLQKGLLQEFLHMGAT